LIEEVQRFLEDEPGDREIMMEAESLGMLASVPDAPASAHLTDEE
jgi:hypothetical protein